MQISAVKPTQGYSIDSLTAPRRKPFHDLAVNRNTGPDTVSISSEAMALSKISHPDSKAGKAKSTEATLPGWFTELLPSGIQNKPLPGLGEVLQPGGAAFSLPALGNPEDQQYAEELFRKFSEILNEHGISTASAFTESTAKDNAFGKILQRELLKAIGENPRLAEFKSHKG